MLLIPACAALNRLRGLEFEWVPGRHLYYVAPVIALLAYAAGAEALTAGLWGFAYLVWGSGPWGRWFDLGRMPELERPQSTVEWIIYAAAFENDHAAMLIRHSFPAPILLFIWPPWAIVFPFTVVALYEAAWTFFPDNPIWRAELAVGALWGFMIALTLVLP